MFDLFQGSIEVVRGYCTGEGNLGSTTGKIQVYRISIII